MNYKGQEALLLWCKTNTVGYEGVLVQNFHSSWKDGLALCALIHKFHPEVVQFDTLSKEKPLENVELALALAAELGVPKLFDPIDMMIEPRPDQRSVMTYLSQMYHVFEKNANPGMGIANISMVGPIIPALNPTPSENNLILHQVSAKPKFSRSISLVNLPKPSTSGPQLQQRIPPLLTKSGTFKYVPAAKKAAAQVSPDSQTSPTSEQPPSLSLDQPGQDPTTPPNVNIAAPSIYTATPSTPPSTPPSSHSAPTTPSSHSAPSTPVINLSALDYQPILNESVAASPILAGKIAALDTPTLALDLSTGKTPILDISPAKTPTLDALAKKAIVLDAAATKTPTLDISSKSPALDSAKSPALGTAKTSAQDTPVAKIAMDVPLAKTQALDIGTTPTRPLASSAPVLPRSITSPSINYATLLASSSAPKTIPSDASILSKSLDEKSIPSLPKSTATSPTPSLITPPASPVLTSSSPSPSPSPSPTLQKAHVKVLSAKSAGEIITKKLDEDKVPVKPSTPPLQSRSIDNTKLKRSVSVTNVTPKNWVNTIKGQGNFIRIKKVEEREGPLNPGSDDESNNKAPPAVPQQRFMVDKVSSSSRSTWLAKLQNRDVEEEDDDEYEYVDNDPNRKYEPHFNPSFKFESCLLRSTSTGKLTMPQPSRGSSKRVTFKEPLPRTESKEIQAVQVEVVPTRKESPKEIKRESSRESVKETIKESTKETPKEVQKEASKEVMKEAPREVVKEVPKEAPKEVVKEVVKEARIEAPKETPAKESTKQAAKDNLEEQLKNNTIKQLERARDSALFHRDEIAAKYSELEQRYKEERAANEALEKETVELHQKLSAAQEQADSKHEQKVADMTQKMAEKDREILKLRMQNTTMKKKVEERDREIEKLKVSRSFSPVPELPIEDLESDNECRQTWENAERRESPPKSVPVHSYGGLKIYIEPSKQGPDSPSSPRFEVAKQFTPESPFSPDLSRRMVTPPLGKPSTPNRPGSESPQIEIAKVTYVQYQRPQTPTKPGDSKFRPQTPTKVEMIVKKTEGTSHHVRSPSLDQLPRPDSQTRMAYLAKSPEPFKNNKFGGINDAKGAPGTPRIQSDAQIGLEPKQIKEDAQRGTKPSIIFSPPTSPIPIPSPRHTPTSPSPSPKPKYAVRHHSNPNPNSYSSSAPNSNYNPISPRANSNPSPSASPSPSSSPSTTIKFPRSIQSPIPGASSAPSPNPTPNNKPSSSTNPSPSPSPSSSSNPSPSPSPNPSSNQTPTQAPNANKDKSKASALFSSLFTRTRSNTLPTEVPSNSLPEANGHHAPVSLVSPRGAQKNETSAKETVSALLPDNPKVPIGRIGRSYSLSAITPSKGAPQYLPSSTDEKPTWLVNLGKKTKPVEENKEKASEKISDTPVFTPQETYTLEQLKNFSKTNEYPSPSFDKTKVEWYLNDEIFKTLFTVTKAEYSRFAKWKQDNLKRKCKMDTL